MTDKGDPQFHTGQPVWVIEPDGSWRRGEYVGEGEGCARLPEPRRAFVVFIDPAGSEVVEVDRLRPREEMERRARRAVAVEQKAPTIPDRPWGAALFSPAMNPNRHYAAAARHEQAAATHEDAARFWDEHGDAERAALQRELAAHERQGAELERRWAELATRETSQPPGTAADPPVL
jgi:hypothetical protein